MDGCRCLKGQVAKPLLTALAGILSASALENLQMQADSTLWHVQSTAAELRLQVVLPWYIKPSGML